MSIDDLFTSNKCKECGNNIKNGYVYCYKCNNEIIEHKCSKCKKIYHAERWKEICRDCFISNCKYIWYEKDGVMHLLYNGSDMKSD